MMLLSVGVELPLGDPAELAVVPCQLPKQPDLNAG